MPDVASRCLICQQLQPQWFAAGPIAVPLCPGRCSIEYCAQLRALQEWLNERLRENGRAQGELELDAA